MELADMQDLGSCAARRAGSSPVIRIKTPERRFRGFLRMETLNPGIQGLRCRSARHPVIRIISFKPFVYKGLELFLILDLSLEQSEK